tara:strand:+ start:315 stop:1304 length:990 start_codon:yes stop_codon:yes gene_type:complete
MNILFIVRDKHLKKNNFDEILKNNLCKLDFGFLLTSLKTFANVDTITLEEFARADKDKEYNHVVIDAKIAVDYNPENFLPHLKQRIKSKVSIFLSYDRPIKFSDVFFYEKFLDVKNYFVPNLLKNNNKYNLPTKLKDKLFATHYGLGFLNIPYDFTNKVFMKEKTNNIYNTNIFYSGLKLVNKQIRTKIIDNLLKDKNIKKKFLNYYDSKNEDASKLSSEQYIEYTKKTRINLVLSGNGNNITYRFYEVLFLNSFFLIDNYFLNYKVSENFDNNSVFVFNSIDDLKKKIHYFINNYQDAQLVKEKQRESFEKFYNPEKHGLILQKLILV